MADAWEVLCAWGVPSGAIRPRPTAPFAAAEVADALAEVAVSRFEALSAAQRECLLAWLRGFRHEWPERFQTILGALGSRAIAELDDPRVDPNRYLKFRRIAIENLAGSL
jgi:hypothetical protein